MSQSSLLLPPLPDGSRKQIDESAKQIVVVGANGSGKSRFAAHMIEDAGASAFPLSALNAIFEQHQGATGNSYIDALYNDSVTSGLPHNEMTTQFDRVLALLMHDEMLNLINFKIKSRSNPEAKMSRTKLDSVIDLWSEVFPGSKVLIESGRMLFTHETDGENEPGYSPSRLSAGEKAVLYYVAAMNYAPKRATVFIDAPEMFLHPTITRALWNQLEIMRSDCRFVYTTHDLDFAASRSASSAVWVRRFDAHARRWDYDVLPPQTAISDEIYQSILGARKPMLFIEGEERRSIDAKLYPLIFRNYTVKALGSCNKVIEATRTFNDLNAFHHMDSCGIVDRDRRDPNEVAYLRRKRIMVPEVAEVENILLIEEVVRAVASHCKKDENRVAERVRKSIMHDFNNEIKEQALMHTRHRVKRIMECRIDGRFRSIEMLEQHMAELPAEINPRGMYEHFLADFRRYVAENDYAAVLRVYNQKSMLPNCNVAGLCGLHDKDDYIYTILRILRGNSPEAARIRTAVTACFGLDPDGKLPPEKESKQ